MRLLVLNQVRLESQGLGLAVGHDEFNLTDLTHHQPDSRAEVVSAAEIAAHATAQALGLPYIKKSVLTIPHQIAAGLRGDLLQALFQPIRLFDQGRHGSNPRNCECIGSVQTAIEIG